MGEAPADDGVVAPGMVVTIAFDGDPDDTMTFLLGSREGASPTTWRRTLRSRRSAPVWNSKKVGEDAEYELPNGKFASVKILQAKPYAA